MPFDIITTIFGVGFIGSALLNAYVISENRRMAKESKIYNNLQAQVTNLYTPLYYLVQQNDNSFNLYDKYHKQYQSRYIDTKWSEDDNTREFLKKESKELLEIANSIIEKFVIKNNEYILSMIKEKAGFIDPDDIDIFNEFEEHFKRRETEFDNSGKLIIPTEVYNNIGNVSFMPKNFSERVKTKYNTKITTLNKLLTK